MILSRHAERRLRKRSGWPRRAIYRALTTLEHEGEVERDGEGTQTYLYRGLRWYVRGGRVVTVVPMGAQSGAPEHLS